MPLVVDGRRPTPRTAGSTARLAKELAALGLDERHLAARQAEAVALLIEGFRAFCAELGHDFADPEIRRAAQRALLTARDARPRPA